MSREIQTGALVALLVIVITGLVVMSAQALKRSPGAPQYVAGAK